jgi:hypothetical protein
MQQLGFICNCWSVLLRRLPGYQGRAVIYQILRSVLIYGYIVKETYEYY